MVGYNAKCCQFMHITTPTCPSEPDPSNTPSKTSAWPSPSMLQPDDGHMPTRTQTHLSTCSHTKATPSLISQSSSPTSPSPTSPSPTSPLPTTPSPTSPLPTTPSPTSPSDPFFFNYRMWDCENTIYM
jgi:hypothetical protein